MRKIFVWSDSDWMGEEDLGTFPNLMDIKSDEYVTYNVPDNYSDEDIEDFIYDLLIK